VWDEPGELVCVCVYRRGAREVARRLAAEVYTAGKDDEMETTEDGFVTVSDTKFLGRLTRRLNEIDPALNAFVEHTGSGIFVVNVSPEGKDWYMLWGTELPDWSAEVCGVGGGYVDVVHTPVMAGSRDLEKVASAVVEATARYRA
jgi:hypothetical protein